MADRKICFVIGPGENLDAQGREKADWLRGNVIEPAIAAFPEYELSFGNGYGGGTNDPDLIQRADLVVADLTGNQPITLYEIGQRDAAGGDAISLTIGRMIYPTMPSVRRQHVECSYPDGALEAREILISRIKMLKDWPDTRESLVEGSSNTRPFSTQVMATRIAEIADAIDHLRVNSTASYVDELRKISEQLRVPKSEPVSPHDASALTSKILYILAQIDEVVGSSNLGKLAISGAIAALVTGGGLASAAVFTLSLAVWDGPAAFRVAVEKLHPPKS
jgi:hypothetical protein